MTTEPHAFAPETPEPHAAGVWTLAGDRVIIAEADGPATILVPSEQVRLIAVDLPLSSRAKRLEALPFAIEDQIAEPIESLHLALGEEVAPKRYLVGVVRHEVMERWVELADAGGLAQAAMVPDALALPQPPEGEWAVDLGQTRALIRSGDGAGFAIAAPLLGPAWEAAGKPAALAYGTALPDEMMLGRAPLRPSALADRLLDPALDLRQGRYARRRAGISSFWQRLGWIVAIGAAAHVVIALADTTMLRSIADRRAAETRATAALAAPGIDLGDDIKARIPDLLPKGGGKAPDAFLPLLTRLSQALQPLAGSLSVRQLAFEGTTLTMDLDGGDPGLAARIEAALREAAVRATTSASPDGSIRITASAA